MIQRREDLRLALEAGDAIDVLRDGVGKNLQRDVAPELRVTRAKGLLILRRGVFRGRENGLGLSTHRDFSRPS